MACFSNEGHWKSRRYAGRIYLFPAYRSVLADEMREGTAEGTKKRPLTALCGRMPLLTYMIFGGVAPMVGAAETLFEMVSDILSTKVGAYSGEKQAGLTTQRVRMARLHMELVSMVGLFEDKLAYGPGIRFSKRAD